MQKIYQNKNLILSYLKTGDRKNQSIVLLPPGIGEALCFDNLIKKLSQKYFVIAIDLPGAGKSLKKSKANLKNIAQDVVYFLKDININNPIIIAESYGGSLAVKISQLIKLQSLVLIGTGEFFNFITKIVFSIIFYKTPHSRRIRKMYAKMHTKLGTFDFKGYTDHQLKNISQRWYDIFWFTLPRNYKNSINTLIIKSKKDRVVKRKSFKKIENIFVNNRTMELNCSHFDYLKNLEENNYQEIVEFLEK